MAVARIEPPTRDLSPEMVKQGCLFWLFDEAWGIDRKCGKPVTVAFGPKAYCEKHAVLLVERMRKAGYRNLTIPPKGASCAK